MKYTQSLYQTALFALSVCLFQSLGADPLYTETGNQPTFNNSICSNANSGTKVTVNKAMFEVGYGRQSIMQGINLHTGCGSQLPRSSFSKMSLWYQEDGNTQIFRLYSGENNTNLGRPRTEVNAHRWGKGPWQEWTGRYTISSKPLGAAIFQIKNNNGSNPGERFHWPFQLHLHSNGDILVKPRYSDSKVIAPKMSGKGFDVRIRDNGGECEIYIDGKLVWKNSYKLPSGSTNHFRWGMYKGDSNTPYDGVLFVSGAQVNGQGGALSVDGKFGNLDKTFSINGTAFRHSSNDIIKSVRIFDLHGTLLDEVQARNNSINWEGPRHNGGAAARGTYVVQLNHRDVFKYILP